MKLSLNTFHFQTKLEIDAVRRNLISVRSFVVTNGITSFLWLKILHILVSQKWQSVWHCIFLQEFVWLCTYLTLNAPRPASLVVHERSKLPNTRYLVLSCQLRISHCTYSYNKGFFLSKTKNGWANVKVIMPSCNMWRFWCLAGGL